MIIKIIVGILLMLLALWLLGLMCGFALYGFPWQWDD